MNQQIWVVIVAFGIPGAWLLGSNQGRSAAEETARVIAPDEWDICEGQVAALLREGVSLDQCAAAVDAAFDEAYQFYRDAAEARADMPDTR